ncbi:hypothetical protein [Neptuniibacter sp.]|uniref:hypothetical protein n=1 Tax=Neptuniibacter sp. TaxID=1962643 RepID=UPI0026365D1F|nr:hypothetical protein [Neptuniibacter sp.]MCP4598465.1 hypothetical protein [Neptuniibacter sp.]
MSKYLIPLLTLLLTGCVTQQTLTSSNDLQINQIIVTNNSPYALLDMEINVYASRGRVACSYVPPEGFCSNWFPARPYQGHAALVSWQLDGKQWQKEVVADDVLKQSASGTVAIELVLGDQGQSVVKVRSANDF